MVEVEGRGNPEFRKQVWIRLDEQEPGHWMLGGRGISAEQIAAIFGPMTADGRRG